MKGRISLRNMSANPAGDDEQLGSAPDPNAKLESVNPLLNKPSRDQLKLLELVWEAFQRHAVWLSTST